MIFFRFVKTFAHCFHNVAFNLQMNEFVCVESLLPVYFCHWVADCEAPLIASFDRLGHFSNLDRKMFKQIKCTCNCLPKLPFILTCLLLVAASAVWNDKTSSDRLVVFLFRVLSGIETLKHFCFKISRCLTYKSGYMQCNIQTKLTKDKPQLTGLDINKHTAHTFVVHLTYV